MGVDVATDLGLDRDPARHAAPAPVEIETHGEHRIVMSFADSFLHAPGTTCDDPGCVRKTFPGFPEGFAEFRGRLSARRC
ncbi:hypothetical protein ABT115_20445 [Streptomyces sp. NPDC001832]|uniref:hypothetical protein n=1 Tax=Streptomyces sp. NPDC001832 TaxID=3154527 RepID=UPI0033315388